jgi:hypothetical protein
MERVVAARPLRHRVDDRLADVDQVVAGDGVALEIRVTAAHDDEPAPAGRLRDRLDGGRLRAPRARAHG